MSRFIDKLKQVSQSEPQPMGFRKEKSTFRLRPLLVAEVKDDAAAGVVEWADAVLLEGTVKNSPEKTDLPVGIRLFGGKAGKLEGIDYVVIKPETPVTIAGDEKIGKVIAVEASLEMGLLRALEDLPLDALFIIGDGTQTQIVTWQYLMLCKRFSAISGKPVLAAVSPDVSQGELQLLWEVGVDGVVVKVAPGQPVERLRELRQMIDGLTLPSRRKRMKARAVVPQLKEEAAPLIDEDEEEEEEE